MKKRRFYELALLLIVPMFLASCKSFLDLKPVSVITTQNAYTTAANIEAALNGAYGSFMQYDFYQWDYINMSDMRSDNAYAGGGGDEPFHEIDHFTISPSNANVYQDWMQLYASIAKCNNVIDNVNLVKDPTLTEERRKQILGEASFLRAFNYYNLVTLWGGVPIEKHSNSTDPSVIRIPRTSDTTVYNFIVSDLQVAVNNLPDSYGAPSIDKVRATKGAANALLAKVWAQRSDRDYNKVLQYCNAVINSPEGYALISNYGDLFDGNHNYNSESIMEIPYLANTPEACWGVELLYPTHDQDGKIPADAWQRYCIPSKSLVNGYEKAGDSVRLNAKISFERAPWIDDHWNPCGGFSGNKVPFDVAQKHPNNYGSGDHVYLLRLADIILLKAEAQNQLGDLSGAAASLNQVRSRVHLSPVIPVSKNQMETAILNERRLELSFEGQRWDDLMRYGTAVSTMNDIQDTTYVCNNGVITGTPVKFNITKQKLLLPIPTLELQANPNLTQNSGY